jgi:hypothetical protein
MALTVGPLVLDQSVYHPGDTITLTVNYSSTDFTGTPDSTFVVTPMISDTSNSTEGGPVNTAVVTVAGTGEVVEPTTVTASDNRTPPGVWLLTSNTVTGSAPTWSGVAVLTSTA